MPQTRLIQFVINLINQLITYSKTPSTSPITHKCVHVLTRHALMKSLIWGERQSSHQWFGTKNHSTVRGTVLYPGSKTKSKNLFGYHSSAAGGRSQWIHGADSHTCCLVVSVSMDTPFGGDWLPDPFVCCSSALKADTCVHETYTVLGYRSQDLTQYHCCLQQTMDLFELIIHWLML